MNWRKSNRWLHRHLGFLFFGMAIVYGVSGIALNHSVARHWNPELVERTIPIRNLGAADRDTISKAFLISVLESVGQRKNYKQHYYPADNHLMIFLKGGHISIDLQKGHGELVRVKKRAVFSEMNFLHYNKAKKLWTWFSDLFGLSLVVLAVTGIIMVKGKKGLRGSGGLWFAAGILIPLLFLAFYLWF